MTRLNTINVKSKVLEILEGNPTIPYSIISRKVGVTRERVRQIAKSNGYPPRRGILKSGICRVCGETYYNKKSFYCSPVCRYKARQKRMVINCNQCGKPIERTPGQLRNKSGKYFCNRVCFGKWSWKKIQ